MNDLLLKLSHRQGVLLLLALTSLIATIVYWDFLTFSKLFLYKDIGKILVATRLTSTTPNIFISLVIYEQRVGLAGHLARAWGRIFSHIVSVTHLN